MVIPGTIYQLDPSASLDGRYGPYESVNEAFETLYADDAIRVGLPVGILNAETGKIEDYWFYGGTARENLVVKLRYDGTFLTVNGEAWQLNLDRPKCAKPTGSTYTPASQSNPNAYGTPNEVTLETTTPGAVILYTKALWDETEGAYEDVVTPTLETGTRYSGPIAIEEGEKYKLVAVAVKEGWMFSDVSDAIFAEYVEVTPPESGEMGGTEKLNDGPEIEF